MIKYKTIGLIFLSLLFIILGLIARTWMNIALDPGPTDGPSYGIMILILVFLAVYYYVMTVWTWRLFKRGNDNGINTGFHYALIFVMGFLVPGLLYINF